MTRFWKLFLAWTRLSKVAVCEMSNEYRYGSIDFHDYPDAEDGYPPMHFHLYRCKRCGKEFSI